MAIRISKPYIKKINNKVRLCADITEYMNGTLYYEVENTYEYGFCLDRSDAFLLGLLHSAMYENMDIICEAPVSSELLFQIKMYYVPVVSRNMPDLHDIKIYSRSIEDPVVSENAVCTGNSGGVDSFYTMLKYSDNSLGEYKLTHAMFNNISTADDEEERIRKLFDKDIKAKEECANALGLKFVSMYSNLYSFYRHPGIYNHYFTLQYVSAAYALSKLFSVFYFSSTFPVEKFSLNKEMVHSSGRFDLFTMGCVSTSIVKVYSTGSEVNRLEKMRYIANNEIVHHYLQVCSIEQSPGGYEHLTKLNCGYCHKCSRTIGILYALDCLEYYENIFDMSYFYSNKGKFIGRGLAADQKVFADAVVKLLKEVNKIPHGTYFWRFMYGIRYKLCKNEKLVKIYHFLKK